MKNLKLTLLIVIIAFAIPLIWASIQTVSAPKLIPITQIAGLNSQTIDDGNLKTIVNIIDPQINTFQIIENKQSIDNTILAAHKNNSSLLTFNGGYFDKEFKALGLLISGSKTLSAINTESGLMTHVFYLDNQNKPHLVESKNFSNKDVKFAVQSGPLLLNQNGENQIKTDTNKKASRTLIGVTKDQKIAVIQIRSNLLNQDDNLSLYQTAEYLKKPTFQEFNLGATLNLDGGPSSGLAINQDYFPEFSTVQNIIITKPL